MASIFDTIKLYASEWNEVQSRKFTQEEAKAIMSCVVVASKFGKSVAFQFANGKRYIPLEPTASVNIGDTLNAVDLILVCLQYNGTDVARQGKQILRVRISQEPTQIMSFDNPFGL